MNKNVLGEYGFTNFYEINIDTPSHLSVQTTIHEAFHMIFALQSSYGIFMNMNRRLGVADGRFTYINKVLAEHCRQVQEAASLFAEITYLVNTHSYETAVQYIQRLRSENREYFNYLKPLQPFFDFLKENETSTAGYKLSMDEMFGLIRSIILISLDIDLTLLDPHVFRKEKMLDRSIVEGLCPNRVFRDTTKQVLNILNQAATPEEIRKELLNFITEQTPACSEENLRLIQEKYLKFFKKLYQDSPNYPVLEDILMKFDIKAVEPMDIMGSGIPETGNPQYPFVKESLEKIIKLLKEDVGVLFILGDMSFAVTELSRNFPVKPQYREMSRNRFLITFLDYSQKQQYGALLSSKQAKQLFRATDTPIVINYKVHHYIWKKFLHTFHTPVFVYCDRSYLNAVEIIRNHTQIEKRFQLVNYQEKSAGFEILLIELESGLYFLLPITKFSLPRLFHDIQSGALKLKEELSINDDLLHVIDIVINCVFYY